MDAPTGQPYGARKQQIDAQRAVPMGTPDVAPPPTGWQPGQPMPQMPKPGSLGDLFADSTNPDENVMNGADAGPGLSMAALGFGPQAEADGNAARVARYLPALVAIANQPGSSPATRAMVRAMRARISGTPNL